MDPRSLGRGKKKGLMKLKKNGSELNFEFRSAVRHFCLWVSLLLIGVSVSVQCDG